jgi:hypothetical protein
MLCNFIRDMVVVVNNQFSPTTTFLFDIRVTTRYVSPAYPREQQEAADVTSLSD